MNPYPGGYYPYPLYPPQPVYYAPGQPYGWPNITPNTFYANLPPINSGGGTTKSDRYPTLNPILAVDSTSVRWDVRKNPEKGIPSNIFHEWQSLQATVHPTSHMRLYSKAFPWTIEILSNHGTPISCGDVWDAIHRAFSHSLADSEWGMLLDNKSKRETIKKAARERLETDKDKWYKRIDYLGENTTFKGLEKDEDFCRWRPLPGIEECVETWMVKMSGRDGWSL